MGEHKVSIIIPAYNMANSIGVCLHSILRQTSSDYEIIVVDDGSTDDTYEVAARLLAGRPGDRVLRQQNAGSGPARNLGIQNATGDYLFFSDADDELMPNCVETILLKAQKDDGLLVFGHKSFSKDGALVADAVCKPCVLDGAWMRQHFDEVLYDVETPRYKMRVTGSPWNKAFRRDVVVNNGIEYPALKRNQDEVFIMRYLNVVSSVRYIPDQLYIHYLNSMEDVWGKFPLDYMNIVLEVLKYRMDIVYNWNRENKRVLDYIVREFTQMTYWALKQVYNPKHGLKLTERLRRLCAIRGDYARQFQKQGCLQAGRDGESRFLKLAPVTLIYIRESIACRRRTACSWQSR